MSGTLRSDEGSAVVSLVEQCYATLTSGKCDWQQLESLPHSMLLSLLKHCAEDCNELKASKEEQGKRLQQLEEEKAGRYHVDPDLSSDRVRSTKAMERLLLDVRSKWQTRPVEGRNAEGQTYRPKYSTHLTWNLKERCFKLTDSSENWELSLSNVISSALLLYRACCLFEVDVNTTDLTDRYKCVWAVQLWHTASGRELYLSEHKGAAQASMAWPEVEDPQLSSDFLQLMNLLCGECPHTYDWLLAGSVA